jgi:hypothetical protein
MEYDVREEKSSDGIKIFFGSDGESLVKEEGCGFYICNDGAVVGLLVLDIPNLIKALILLQQLTSKGN